MEKHKECFVIRDYPAFTGAWSVAYRGTILCSVICADGRHFNHVQIERAYPPFHLTPHTAITENADLFLSDGNDAFTMIKAETECHRRNELRRRETGVESASAENGVQ